MRAKANANAEAAAKAKANANARMKSILVAKAQKARNTVKTRANAEAAVRAKANANARTKLERVQVQARTILATYKGTNQFRKAVVMREGTALIDAVTQTTLGDLIPAIIKKVRDAKMANASAADAKLIGKQTYNAAEQSDERKKKENANKEAARLARIAVQKKAGQAVAANRTLAQFKANAQRSKNAMANKKAINEMKNVSNKKAVSNLVGGALAKAVKAGPVTTVYQSSTNANRIALKQKVSEKVDSKGYKVVWDTMINLDGKDKAGLSKIENRLNKKYALKQGIRGLAPEAFRPPRTLPGTGVGVKTTLLTQVMRPYIGGGDKYNEHKRVYNTAELKGPKMPNNATTNPLFNNTANRNVQAENAAAMKGVFRSNPLAVNSGNVNIQLKRAMPPPGAKPPNGRALQRFKAVAQKQIPPTKPAAIAKAFQITMNKQRAVGNPAAARNVYTNQGKFTREMNKTREIRKAAEGAAMAAKGKIAREAVKTTGWNLTTNTGRAKDRVSRTFPGGKDKPVMMRLRKRYHGRIDLVGTRPDAPNMNAVMANVNRAAIEHQRSGAIKQISLSKT